MTLEARLMELGIELADVARPKFSYVPAVQTGNTVYISGQDCKRNGALIVEGKLGDDVSVEEGQQAARQCAIKCLSVLKWHLGDLGRVKQIVKVVGVVQSATVFQEQPYVVNGASDLLLDVFGGRGRHARSAIGANELPFNTPLIVEMVVEVE